MAVEHQAAVQRTVQQPWVTNVGNFSSSSCHDAKGKLLVSGGYKDWRQERQSRGSWRAECSSHALSTCSRIPTSCSAPSWGYRHTKGAAAIQPALGVPSRPEMLSHLLAPMHTWTRGTWSPSAAIPCTTPGLLAAEGTPLLSLRAGLRTGVQAVQMQPEMRSPHYS